MRSCLEQKPQPVVLISVGPDDKRLSGIVTQGDCAIKVLLPGLDATQVSVKEIMTAQPVTVNLADPIEACMGLMAVRNFRHLLVVEGGRVVGVVPVIVNHPSATVGNVGALTAGAAIMSVMRNLAARAML